MASRACQPCAGSGRITYRKALGAIWPARTAAAAAAQQVPVGTVLARPCTPCAGTGRIAYEPLAWSWLEEAPLAA